MKVSFQAFFCAIILILFINHAGAQAPNISYSPSTNVYPIGSAITSLTPTNSGGAVPATTYGTVSTLAASSTNIDNPRGLTADASGNVYEADFTGNVIYKISSTGTATIIAGSGAAAELDGNGTAAKFNGPSGIVYDGSTYLYVADNGGNTIRRITVASPYTVLTIAGSGTAAEASGNGTAAKFNKPYGIDYDGSANLYVTDNAGYTIRKVATASPYTVTTIAGSGTAGETNSTTGTSAKFNGPSGIVYDGSANLYVADEAGNTIREISTTSPYAVTTFAGSGTAGSTNATGTSASFNAPYGINIDATGNLIVADEGNNLVRTITSGGVVTTLAGSGTKADLDGVTTAAEFYSPYAVTTDNLGNAYTGDNDGTSSTVRKILLTGYTISATLPAGLSFAATTGYISGTPTATSSATVYTITGYNATGSASTTVTISTILYAPAISYSPATNSYLVGTAISTLAPSNTGGAVGSFGYGTGIQLGGTLTGADAMVIDASGNIYISDYSGGKIYEYSSSGTYIGTFGSGITMSEPASIVFDSSGNCYVLDTGNKCVYKFNSAGVYQSTIISGLNTPYGIDIDASNYIYLADDGANTVKKYNTSGTLQLTLPTTNLDNPSGVAVDQSGNIYVLNYTNGKVGKYTSAGVLTNASFITGLTTPWVITVDGGGNIYIGNSGNSTVQVYNSSGTLLTTISNSHISAPDGLVPDASGNLYVSDYTNNTVYKYPPIGGYFINAQVPAGLNFDLTTGDFTGTPTASTAATTYTVTAYNATGSGSTTETISCYQVYQWVGGVSTNWSTATNWSPATVPGSSDEASIGANSNYTNLPTISATTVNVGSIIFGTQATAAASLSVNTGCTLNVARAITYQSDSHAYQAFVCTLSGAGTINADSISVIGNTVLAGHPYTETLASSVTNLNVATNVALTSTYSSSYAFNAEFNLTGGTMLLDGALQTTNTTGSTSTFAVVPTSAATLQLTGATALSGLSSSGTNVVTFNNTGATVQYSATAAQTVYTAAAITGLSSGVSYTNITFSGSSIKTASSGNLNVAGNFTNSLTLNDASDYINLASPTVVFNGASAQNIYAGNGTGTTFYNTTFSGTGTTTIQSGEAYIASSGVLTMSGSSAILAAGGLLTLNSASTGSATVAKIPTGCSISGTVNVQRYITGGSGYRTYRLISSPVYAATVSSTVYSINYLQNSIYLTGNSGGGFDKTGNPTLYLFREDQTPSNASFTSGNFWGISAINNSPTYNYYVNGGSAPYNFPVGGGLMFFFRGNKASATVTTETSTTYTTPVTVTMSTLGTLNQGQVIVRDWYTPTSPSLGYTGTGTAATTNYAVRGFNLVGNPYASSIDWSTFSNTNSAAAIYGLNIGPTIWTFDPGTKNYATYNATTGIATGNGGKIIASGQGFFVLATLAAPSLTFQESSKSNTQVNGSSLLMDKRLAQSPAAQAAPVAGPYSSYLRLKLITDTVNYNDIVIGFNPSATTKFNPNIDSRFVEGMGNSQAIAAISSDSINVAAKWVAYPKNNESLIIPLHVSVAASGTYTMLRTDFEAIPTIYEVWLMDNYKKDSLNISNSAAYVFSVDISDTTTFGNGRFEVVIRQNPTQAFRLINFTAVKAQAGAQIKWVTQNEANYTDFEVQRSTDGGKTFNVLSGFVSSALGTYSYVDEKPQAGADTYRLQITDLNGNITYSANVTLLYGDITSLVKTGIMVYPNPASSTLNLNISTGFNPNTTSGSSTTTESGVAYNIQISNIMGTVVTKTSTNTQLWQTDVSSLMPGTYVIQVTNKSNNAIVGQGTFIKL